MRRFPTPNRVRCCVVLVSIMAFAHVLPAQEQVKKYKLDLSNTDLSRETYDGKEMSDTNFENSTLFLAGFREAVLQRCNFQAAKLISAAFNNADLTGADFRFSNLANASLQGAITKDADFTGVNFQSCSLQNARMMGAKLFDARGFENLNGANFSGADLRGADLSRSSDYGTPPVYRGAKYSRRTRWPARFDPVAAHAVLTEDPPAAAEEKPAVNPLPASPTTVPDAPASASLERQFTSLDTNADGVLSGKEAKPFVAFDIDQDGDVTKAEFIAGRSKPNKP
ncbi:MAG: pentapeptide repeat-containing protein [Planctomycetia bacterium]|nr:pentapeptide repeat-containing protein [Planctomycetia bacterium]